jgi:hypothetical protein
MKSYNFSYRISPEVLITDKIKIPFSGISEESFCGTKEDVLNDWSLSYYSGMSYILSGGTCNCDSNTCIICKCDKRNSYLTGLTIPIVFLQTINDIGYYSEFDGFILQKDILTNFVYSGNPLNQYEIFLYNTSGDIMISYLADSNYIVDWGDGVVQQLQSQLVSHIYPNTPSDYQITISGTNQFGTTVLKRDVYLPTTGVTINNILGNITFTPQGGNWSGIPLNYDYLFTGDSENNIQSQITSNFVPIPYQISGFTTSKLQNLRRWGPVKYNMNTVFKNNQPYGQVTDMNSDFTAYTINGVTYFDFSNGKTFYVVESSGLTANDILSEKITKDELLMDMVMAPEIITDVYIQRGKYSAFENLQRLGEVDNIGDLVRYGYGYFKINTT